MSLRFLELRVSWSSWEGDHITDVAHAGNKQYHAFKSESKSGVWRTAKSSGIEVPTEFFRWDMHFFHTLAKLI